MLSQTCRSPVEEMEAHNHAAVVVVVVVVW